MATHLSLHFNRTEGASENADGNMLHVKQAIVDGEDGPEEKGTKTYSGGRWIRMPDYVKQEIEARRGRGDRFESPPLLRRNRSS